MWLRRERLLVAGIVNSIPGEADPAGAHKLWNFERTALARRGDVNRREVTRRRPLQSADSLRAFMPALSASCSSESHTEATVAPA